MRDTSPPKPGRCVITKIGLAAFVVSALCLPTILVVQFLKTGSFGRGNGFVLGPSLAPPMLYGLAGALVLLIVGGIVDSIRYDRARKAAKARSPAKP